MQINQTSWIDEQDNLIGIEPIHPSNLLSNALAAFNTLPNKQKDELIQKYEGGMQDFPDV